MSSQRKTRIEFGDFQTPAELARQVCERLRETGLRPQSVVEPTCGVGAFVLAAAEAFPEARILGCEVNPAYLGELSAARDVTIFSDRIALQRTDFFSNDWATSLAGLPGELLVLGNLPWVTNSVQGAIGGTNLPEKNNFLGFSGFDAISGKANFDISESMLISILKWFDERPGAIAMLVKTSVARKVLAHAERLRSSVSMAYTVGIDTKKHFGASVDSCLLVMRFAPGVAPVSLEYTVFDDFSDKYGHRVGHRFGMSVSDLDQFDSAVDLVGHSPQKWRSGIKHDAAGVMELTRTAEGMKNSAGELVDLEDIFLYPLMKGSDVAGGKPWREKFVIVTQRAVGGPTDFIQSVAPKTWAYLMAHAKALDGRSSSIYQKTPRFSVFGIGDYAFLPWRIAICGLYKKLTFQLVGPIEGKPVMFDDTVYYLSFATKLDAERTLDLLRSPPSQRLLTSLIFWDEKRPIKTGILNLLDWSRLEQPVLL